MSDTLIYTPNPADVGKFLRHIQSAGVPEKVTNAYLESVGFKSKNHRYLIPVFKALNFIDSSGTPTKRWNEYRDKGRSKQVLGAALKEAYADLFRTYPDAERKDTEAIRNFLSARSKVAEITLQRAVATFKAIAGESDLTASAAPAEAKTPPAPTLEHQPAVSRSVAGVSVNIELHLPATDDASVYDKLFAAMRKHLLD